MVMSLTALAWGGLLYFPIHQTALSGLGFTPFCPLPLSLSSGGFSFMLSPHSSFLLPGDRGLPLPPTHPPTHPLAQVCGVTVVTAVLNWFFSLSLFPLPLECRLFLFNNSRSLSLLKMWGDAMTVTLVGN